jgi:hypothetical protein
MKKAILIAILIMAAGRSISLAGTGSEKNNSREITIQPFDRLSISANITVILYESDAISTVIVEGKANHSRKVVVLQKDSKLLITSNSGANLKEEITVFVPVNRLKSLEVSEGASVKSQTILESPGLELSIEGLSKISIIVNGGVQIKSGDQQASVRQIRPEQAIVQLARQNYRHPL